MLLRSLSLIIATILLYGCAGTGVSLKKASPTQSMYLNASVISANVTETIVNVKPIDNYSGGDIERTLAAEVQNITYLIEGSYTKINNKEYLVKERRGNTLVLQGPPGLKPKQEVNLYIPKKDDDRF